MSFSLGNLQKIAIGCCMEIYNCSYIVARDNVKGKDSDFERTEKFHESIVRIVKKKLLLKKAVRNFPLRR